MTNERGKLGTTDRYERSALTIELQAQTPDAISKSQLAENQTGPIGSETGNKTSSPEIAGGAAGVHPPPSYGEGRENAGIIRCLGWDRDEDGREFFRALVEYPHGPPADLTFATVWEARPVRIIELPSPKGDGE